MYYLQNCIMFKGLHQIRKFRFVELIIIWAFDGEIFTKEIYGRKLIIYNIFYQSEKSDNEDFYIKKKYSSTVFYLAYCHKQPLVSLQLFRIIKK